MIVIIMFVLLLVQQIVKDTICRLRLTAALGASIKIEWGSQSQKLVDYSLIVMVAGCRIWVIWIRACASASKSRVRKCVQIQRKCVQIRGIAHVRSHRTCASASAHQGFICRRVLIVDGKYMSKAVIVILVIVIIVARPNSPLRPCRRRPPRVSLLLILLLLLSFVSLLSSL